MSTNHKKPYPHVHAEVIKAWADGSEIQFKSPVNGWLCIDYPAWSHNTPYRVTPCCSYAIDKIFEQSEKNEVVNIYKNWLAGQTTTATTPGRSFKVELSEAEHSDDPFGLFFSYLKQGAKVENINKKTKQVLIVYCHSVETADTPAVRRWHNTNEVIPTDWYEVPSMTREAQVYD